MNTSMFEPEAVFTRKELGRYADEGVSVFLAAYGAPDYEG
jgi:hypothetical protein